MEGKSRSGGNNSGGVVKNRSSSGCLVIKKKLDGGSGSNPKVYESKKAKKRARVSVGDSFSSDEEQVDYYRRQGGYNDFGEVGYRGNGLMKEGGMKRNELDIYDFDEYDDLSDMEMFGARYFYGREIDGGGGGGSERRSFSPMTETKSGNGGAGGGMEFEGGSSKGDIIYKRRKSFHGSTSGDYYSGKRRFMMKNELPTSVGNERFAGSDEAIRLQGKNGVLKVRVKNKTEGTEHRPQIYRPMDGDTLIHRGQELTAKSIVIQRHSPYSERKLLKTPITACRINKKPVDKRKSWPAKSSEESDEESEDGDSSGKLHSDSVKVRQPMKRGRKARNMQSPENSQPVKAREGKVKRGSGTEKQLLREKIKGMLIDAGWTIDYRPRRGRDYSDAVYINPTGTAFWSIIKAYDAYQKQLEEEGKCLKASDDSSSLAPIPDDTLSKLTRQTRKKIEKELKRKKQEENGAKKKRASRNFEEDESGSDKLRSYMKRSGKPSKSPSKDAWRDISNSNSKVQERGDRFIHARKSNKIGRCTLLVRNSGKGHDFGTDGFVPYTGKRNLLSWLIDSGTVELSEKVHYMNRRRTRVMLEGWITKDGIHCGCCSKILTVTKFEIHAGSKLRQPFQNIYLSSGPSLLQCLVDTWNKQVEPLRNGFNEIDVEGEDPNDDTCAICADGGNLICCDSCPSTFHQNCLDIQMLPPGDWHCPQCSCKFCGLANVVKDEGNDSKEDILFTCNLCERKYHCSCAEVEGSTISNSALSFCGKICHEIFEKLQKIFGIKHELEEGLCWSLIRRTDLGSDNSVRSFSQRVEWNSKLAVALSIMDECFLPITDRRSGINMIHNVFYNCGSNFTRLNYNGFYTAVLERSDEIISAASIRIHGTQFAEMPFIGTRHIYRRQGMCRRLFSAIESALCSLNVEKLIIPAISELMDTWTKVFGFSTLEEPDKRGMKMMNMLVFPGTDMLQKNLLDQDGFENNLAGVGSLDGTHNALEVSEFRQTSDIDSPPGPHIATASQDGENLNGSSNEAIPVVSGEGSQGTTDSPMHLDIKLKESKEGLNDQITSSTKEDIDVTEDGKHELPTDLCKLASEARETDEKIMDTGFPSNGDSLSPGAGFFAGGNAQSISAASHDDIKLEPVDELKDCITSKSEGTDVTENALDNSDENHEVSTDCKLTQEACKTDTEMIGNGLPSDDKAHNDGSLSPNPGAAIGGKHQSISEIPHDHIVIEKSSLDVDNIGEATETNVDGAHTVPGNVVDACSELPLPNVSNTTVGASHEPESCNTIGAVSCQPILEGDVENKEKIINEVADIRSVGQFATETANNPEVAPVSSDVGIMDAVVTPVCEKNDHVVIDNIGDTSRCSIDEAHTVPGNIVDACSELPLPNVSNTTVGASHEPESCNTIGAVSCQPILEGDVENKEKIINEVADIRPAGQFATEIANNPEVAPVSSDVGIMDAVVTPVCEKNDHVVIDNIGNTSRCSIDGAHTVPGNIVDACSELPLPNVSNTTVGASHEPESCNTIGAVVSQPMLEGDVENKENIIIEVADIRPAAGQFATEIVINPEVAPVSSDVGIMDAVVTPVCENDYIEDTSGCNIDGAHTVPENVVDGCSELPTLNVSETIVGASREPESYVYVNDVVCSPLSAQLSVPDDDGTCRSPQNDRQPILDGDVKNEENVHSAGQFVTETTNYPEGTLVSADAGITDAGVSPISEDDDQSSK